MINNEQSYHKYTPNYCKWILNYKKSGRVLFFRF
jgi:hypothetical protein